MEGETFFSHLDCGAHSSTVYMYRLYLEYARAMLREEDGSGMDYEG